MPVYAWPKIGTFAISFTLQFFFPDYAVVKEQPRRGGEIRFRAENAAELVGVPGVEPGTSSLSGTRSNQLSYTPAPPRAPPRALSRGGGGSRGRTGDIQLAKLALCQLSYAPGGRLSRRSLKRCSGRQSRSGRDAEDFFLHSQD